MDVRKWTARLEQRRRDSTGETHYADLPVASRMDRRSINEKRNATAAVRGVSAAHVADETQLIRRALVARSDITIEPDRLARAYEPARRDSRQQRRFRRVLGSRPSSGEMAYSFSSKK
ncbi:hypothetical protein BJG93_27255 [Paraburkholderia sprentiae WSM5005]|uniref:Uncharacterized protein n=1 Tax=Paraburkholderia sprentiae WSM5005 TaxID=754502 RepID=A0A1L1PCZ4_9BURK|nr:hypothetical protein [Paraburkholderia sprentiae]APA88969.2 hypothetical protein BJG93_27255 [Paraburkholderia sprentiae WSM5005]